MPAAKPMPAMPPNRIDFVDENNARCGFLSLLKHVTDSRGTHPNKHLDKIRSANTEERDVCFAGDCPGKKRLACSRRSHHQDAFRNTATECLEFLRILQEIDDLLDFLFGFFDPRDI